MLFFKTKNELVIEVIKIGINLPPNGSCLIDFYKHFFGFSMNPITSPTSKNKYMLRIKKQTYHLHRGKISSCTMAEGT